MQGFAMLANLLRSGQVPPDLGGQPPEGTLSSPPPSPGRATGDTEQSVSAPEPDTDTADVGGIGELPYGGHDKATWKDILPTGLAGIASMIAEKHSKGGLGNSLSEGLSQLSKGYGDEKMNQITTATKEKHDQELALIQDAHKAWQEVHGMDVAGMPPGVRAKIKQLNEVYNSALQDGKISAKEALEISAYAGMVKRAANEGKGQQQAGDAADKAISDVGSKFAGRAEEQRLAGATDPQAAAAGGLKYDLEKPIREQQLKEKGLQNKIDVANIRAKATMARIKKVTDGMDPKRGDQIFRNYMSMIGQAVRNAENNGTDAEAEIARIDESFNSQYGSGKLGGGAGSPPWQKSRAATTPGPGNAFGDSGGVPLAAPIQLAPGITATRR